MLMVKAGEAVDGTIASLLPHLEAGDVVIDGGNSNFEDSIRRAGELESRGLLFVGTGISGGEEGARHGPSIMPGGSAGAWPLVKELFQAIAAKVEDGTPCCDWVGENGSGHYVKMVHNGIEYGDMQVIAEAYHLLRSAGPRPRRAARDLRGVEPRQARFLPRRDHERDHGLPRRRRRAARREDPRHCRSEGDREVDSDLVARAGDAGDSRRGGRLSRGSSRR